MAIFGHSKFIPVFLGKLVRKIWNGHFWLFQVYTNLFGKTCQKKFGTAIFDHSKFIPVFLVKIVRKKLEQPILAILSLPVFLGKIVRKNLEWPFMVVLSLYQSFWEKLLEKIWNSHFGHSEFIPVFFRKIVRKNSEWPFLAVLTLYQSFWEKLSEKIWNGHFWLFQIFSDNFSVHITLIECNGL